MQGQNAAANPLSGDDEQVEEVMILEIEEMLVAVPAGDDTTQNEADEDRPSEEARAEEEGADDETDVIDIQSAVVTMHPRADRNLHLRIVEAVLFATAEPVDVTHLKSFLPEGADVEQLLADLQANYANRGVSLVEVSGKWLFRTADDLSYILRREQVEQR